MDDLRSDSETDDEDNPKKQVPKWAEGTQLRTALLKQCYMGPDVDNIFFRIEDPDLSLMFNQQKKRFVAEAFQQAKRFRVFSRESDSTATNDHSFVRPSVCYQNPQTT